MLFVYKDQVGSTAFARLQRDGLVHTRLGSVALPADVPSTRALRLQLIAPLVPQHTWLTGLAALWLEGLAPSPSALDLAGPRGTHRTLAVPGSPPLAFHSGWLWGLPDAPSPRAATVTRACLDALTHSSVRAALPAVMRALGAGATSVNDLVTGVHAIERHSHHRARLDSLVTAIAELRAA